MTPFSEINRMRCEQPDGFNHKLSDWSLSDWMVATLGELGEAANVLKKLNRVRDGIPNTGGETLASLKRDFADELADADIYLDLLYQATGINRVDAVLAKFNATSAKRGIGPEYTLAVAVPMMVRTVQGVRENAPTKDGLLAAADAVDAANSQQPDDKAPVEFGAQHLLNDSILRYFQYAHLPEKLRTISEPFCRMAQAMVTTLPRNAERTMALRKLLEAKDCAVRAMV